MSLDLNKTVNGSATVGQNVVGINYRIQCWSGGLSPVVKWLGEPK